MNFAHARRAAGPFPPRSPPTVKQISRMTSMGKTESTVRNLLTAIEAPLYDVGVLSDRGMLPGLDSISAAAVLDRLPLLKYRNAHDSHIYIRPSGEHRFTTLDDLHDTSIARLAADGFNPMCCCRDQRRQLSSLAQAPQNVSEAPRNLCRADIGGAIRCRPQRGGLEEVWTASRLHQLQT
jgi:hypothetical protein